MNTNDAAFLQAMKKTQHRVHGGGRPTGAKDKGRRKNLRYHWDEEDIQAKFEARTCKFHKSGIFSGCWMWTGATTRGFGYMVIGSRQDNDGKSPRIQAHRLSWLLHNSELLSKELVGHECGRKLCVNPDHLFIWRR